MAQTATPERFSVVGTGYPIVVSGSALPLVTIAIPDTNTYTLAQIASGITLSCRDDTATIYYNIGDGSQEDPTYLTGTVFDPLFPIQITSTATIKYFARGTDSAEETVRFSVYTITFAIDGAVSSSTINTITIQSSLKVADMQSATLIDTILMVEVRPFVISSMTSNSSIESPAIYFNGGQLAVNDMASLSSISDITIGTTQFFQIDPLISVSAIAEVVLTSGGGTFDIYDMVSASTIQNFSLLQATIAIRHLGAGSGGLVKDIYGNPRVTKLFYSNNWISPN